MHFLSKTGLLALIMICLHFCAKAQYVYTIKADTVKITNCDSAELVLQNHTQGVHGFLFNAGNGRTVFQRGAQQLSSGVYLVGADTIRASPNAWVQGGNAFGTTGVIGTTDLNPLSFYTDGIEQARLTTNGDLLMGSTVDSNYKIDVKAPVRFGSYSGINTVRGNLNFDNGVYPSYIMQGGSTSRSLQIPGTSGSSSWIFKNTVNEGVEFVDVSGTIFLQGGSISIAATNFNNVGPIITTASSTASSETLTIGNTGPNHANASGTNVQIVAGAGGTLANGNYNGGNMMINPGAGGPKGANGYILLGNQVGGNVGIQTASPVSNLEVDQSTTGSGTVTTGAGGTTVTGNSTAFTNTFKVGDSITIAGQKVAIHAIASDISMTTDPIAAADTNVSYTLTGGPKFHVKGNGNVGVGVSAPTSQVDILSSSGYSQLRLRTSYTPSSSSDPNGNIGDFAWDQNYVYVKTPSGWMRSTLNSF